jgi:hypothetical protein
MMPDKTLPPGIKRALDRSKKRKSVAPVPGAREARQAIQGYIGMDPSYSVMDPEAQSLASAYRSGEAASVLGDLAGALSPLAMASAAAKANQLPGIAELIAYHGSPHKFKKFDASKIGTGEGAQAYGHGLYFAESPEVAKSYRITTTGKLHELSGVPSAKKWQKDMLDDVSTFMSRENISDPVLAIEGYAKELEKLTEAFPDQAKHIKAKADWLLSHKNTAKAQRAGSLYTVDIPDEKVAQMLDWDKPLSQQPKAVQEFADKILNDPRRKQAGFTGGKTNAFGKEMTGADFYNTLTPTWLFGGEKGGVEAARQAGIPGIRYLDQGSRGNYQAQTTYKGKPYGDVVSFATQKQLDDYVAEKTAEGFGVNKLPQSSNFVVFPGEEESIKMLDINGEPQMAKGGAVHVSNNPDTMLLELMRNKRYG